jgi:uncharacterized caspase-like protein
MQAKTYIVCVGVSDYPGTNMDLRVSAGDSRTIYKIFLRNGNSEAVCVSDSLASFKRVSELIDSTFSKAKTEDVVIFYFSGHGFPGGLFFFDTHVYYEDIFNLLKKSKARNKVIFADACYSGKMRKEDSKKDQSLSDTNVMFFLSSRSQERSSETIFNNSLFTLYLERALRGGADYNRDRIITARELFDFVHQGVTKESMGFQHPVMWGKFNAKMPIIKW